MSDTSGLARALSGPTASRFLRLGIVEADNDTAVPPTLTVNSRMMRYVNRVPIGQAGLYLDEGQDPVVLGKLSEGDDGVPVGTVLDFAGSTAPPGYLLCNGQSTSGYPKLQTVVGSNVPDLRDRFVVGAGSSYSLDATGGASSVALSSSHLPSHSHSIGSHSHGIGSHSHSIGSHSHSFSGSAFSAGSHSHSIDQGFTSSTSHSHAGAGGVPAESPNPRSTGGDVSTGSGGSHSHSLSGSIGNASLGTGSTSISTDLTSLGTGSAGVGNAHENMPPFWALTKIIRAE